MIGSTYTPPERRRQGFWRDGQKVSFPPGYNLSKFRRFVNSPPRRGAEMILMSKESETTLTPDHVGAGVAFKEQKI